MEQVLMNLAVNARDAMPHGGKLTIETANISIDEDYARRHMGFGPGDCVVITITDTGVGMNPQTQKHIFEPFYTTKAKGEGTGLGLSTVYGIVNQSGGHIRVRSEPGKGTCFKIYFPQIPESVEALETTDTPDEAIGGTETILLVEDDDIVRNLVKEMLTRFGYRVLPANCAVDADRIVAAHDGKIEMLLTDVVIPGGESGAQLAKRFNEKMPSLKVLFMSGYTDDAIVHHGVLDTDVAFIQKPFLPVDLAHMVRQTLDDTE
jgi:two-component system, cell cycle sensor histidine kinase and response regulator CckA